MRPAPVLVVQASLLMFGAAVAVAEPPTLRIPRVATPPSIEAYLDRRGETAGVRVAGFVQREPGDGVPVSQDTVAYLAYDTEQLYVAFVCRDEPGKVRATLTKREAITGDDFVAVILDTYHDGQRAYLFIANPLGIQLDGVTAEGRDDDYSYDTLWRSEGRLTADGFVVLMAIPFRSLRFSNASVQTWGVSVARQIVRTNETAFWPYMTRRISGMGQQLATLEGIEGVSPGRNLQAIPYGNLAAASVLGEDGRRVADHSGRAGLDAKAVIRDAVTVDLTVNPDFSQVESDEPQVTVNQRFEVFFPEKRPFFIENAGLFDTHQRLFFSRRIADPKMGVRVTGKAAGWTFAGLAVDDEQAGRAVATDDPRRDARAGIAVLRLRRDLPRQSYLGAFASDRELGPTANRVLGADGRWRLSDTWLMAGQWAGSRTVDVDGAARSGSSWYAAIERDGRNFNYEGTFLARSPGFRSDVGFIPRVDMRETRHEVRYMWFPTRRRVLRAGPELEVSGIWDAGGELQDWSIEPRFEVEFAGQTNVSLGHWRTFERFDGIEFRRHETALWVESQWWQWLGLSGELSLGTGLNYYPAEGLAPFLGDEQRAEVGLTLRPFSRLRVDATYLFSRLSTRDGWLAGPRGDVFNNHIARARVNCQVSRPLSVRAIVDYDAVLPNAGLVSLDREKRVNFDLMVTYLVNPWTAAYAGYADAYENWRLDGAPGRPPARGGPPTASAGRQVFIKLSYLLRY